MAIRKTPAELIARNLIRGGKVVDPDAIAERILEDLHTSGYHLVSDAEVSERDDATPPVHRTIVEGVVDGKTIHAEGMLDLYFWRERRWEGLREQLQEDVGRDFLQMLGRVLGVPVPRRHSAESERSERG